MQENALETRLTKTIAMAYTDLSVLSLRIYCIIPGAVAIEVYILENQACIASYFSSESYEKH